MSFIHALEKRNSGRIPIWMMRQAGRYLPEYQALRAKYDFRTMSHDPKLICKTTLTPFAKYDLDAAILFSDILTCLEYMGSTFHFGEVGPVLEDHGPHVLQKLTRLDAAKDMSFVGEGIRLIKDELTDKPLIGFVGAPFTLISYLVEGGTSREFTETRKFLYEKPDEFLTALELIADSVGDYLVYQIESGADAVQIFDSWVGILPQCIYRDMIAPTMKRLISKVKKQGRPVILYSQPTSHILADLASLEPSAISIDWRQTLTTTVKTIKNTEFELPTLQGNLDPLVTTLDWEQARPYVIEVLDQVYKLGIENQYVFNVGHGVMPETKWETVGEIIKFVHEYKP